MGFLSNWKGRRVLVTGGTGFIGQHVLRQGLTAGVEIHNLSLRGNTPKGVFQHQVDLREREQVFDVLNEVAPEGIIHLAAAGVSYGSNDLAQMLQANVIGTENVLAAAAAAEAKPFVVMAGSGFEYAPQERPLSEADPVVPFSAYGISKVAAGLCASLHAKKYPITLLRLFSVYGPGEKATRLVPYIISCAKEGRPVELTGGEQVRDYTYVGDVAESFWRALSTSPADHSWRILNVGTGSAISLRRFVVKVSEILEEMGLAPKILFGARPYRPDEPMTYVADVRLLKKALGWVPSTAIDDGLNRTVAAML